MNKTFQIAFRRVKRQDFGIESFKRIVRYIPENGIYSDATTPSFLVPLIGHKEP
jgi:hypothetical protein